jgi:hypothetical protein
MHENRETSRAPRHARERGRSAKVQSHKADTHALEESDRAILSMNQTNKEERSSAEPGEKRARAKENIVPSNTHSTQCGDRVFQGLSGVRGATLLVTHPRWEPYAGKPLVRFCAGGDQRWSSLPQHVSLLVHCNAHCFPSLSLNCGRLYRIDMAGECWQI